MGFQTKYTPILTLPARSTPLESDSESVTTIPTKNQIKRSKNAPVRPVNNNDGYHLVDKFQIKQRVLLAMSIANALTGCVS